MVDVIILMPIRKRQATRRGSEKKCQDAPRMPLRALPRAATSSPSGITIIELVIALAIVSILASITIPLYNDYRYQAMVSQARSDIVNLDYLIVQFQSDGNGQLPTDLSDVGQAGLLDPWGNPYQYLNLFTLTGNGQARKDKNLVPINSDYDLYSRGKDGESQTPLTAKASRDDIVRANNGRFVGLASDY